MCGGTQELISLLRSKELAQAALAEAAATRTKKLAEEAGVSNVVAVRP